MLGGNEEVVSSFGGGLSASVVWEDMAVWGSEDIKKLWEDR